MSGIYITGMEMPTTYPLTVTIFPDGQVLSETVGAKDKHGFAVPVPPHGLIAREQILDAIRLELAQADACNDTEDYDSWMRVFDYVRKFPTFIPADKPKEDPS